MQRQKIGNEKSTAHIVVLSHRSQCVFIFATASDEQNLKMDLFEALKKVSSAVSDHGKKVIMQNKCTKLQRGY